MTKTANLILGERYKSIFNDLSDKQAGALIKAVFNYHFDLELAAFSDLEIKTAFKFLKQDIDFNKAKYAEVSEIRKEAGKQGGAPQGNGNANKQNKHLLTKQAKTSKTSKTSICDKDNNKENVNVKEEDKDVNDVCAEQPQAVDTAPPADEPQNQNPHSQKEDLESIPPELQGLNLYEADLKLRKRWQELRQAWSEAYPGVDIAKQIRAAHAAQVERDRPILLKMFKEWQDKHPEFRQSAP
jgi:hypothetical protein